MELKASRGPVYVYAMREHISTRLHTFVSPIAHIVILALICSSVFKIAVIIHNQFIISVTVKMDIFSINFLISVYRSILVMDFMIYIMTATA